ncbi:MAG: Ig-like domain-containing protein [Bacteroidales bacterium]
MVTRTFLILTLIVFISACAKISAPSGGPRDKLPPVVMKCVPVNGARNFKGNKIAITFNEYVVLDNINEKFMVSPPMKKKPRVFIRGKSVDVEFDDKLKDSTTYTFNFQDAIKDLNEGNILENYQFVFSTGSVIDSLSVTGNIYNASDLEVPEKTEVLLYRELADSAVVKHLPEYISRVDQNGYFRIDNISQGTYRLYGLKDLDNSKNYNHTDEDFAFMDSSVVITPEKNFIPPPPVIKDTTTIKKGISKKSTAVKDTTTVKKGANKVPEPVALVGEYRLFLFAAQKKAHYLTKSARNFKYQLLYVLSLPPDSMKFEFYIPGVDNKAYFSEPSKNRDTLKIWLTDSTLISLTIVKPIVRYPFTDTLGILGYKQDTIPMRSPVLRTTRVSKVQKTSFTVESNISNGYLKPGQTIVFESKTPFRKPDKSRIQLYELIEKTSQNVPFSLVKDSTNSCKYFLKTKLLEGKKYLFVANAASFGNIYNENSDSLGIKFSIKDPESYCKLTLNIKNYDGDRIIQLHDKSGKLIAEAYMKKDGKIVFPLLENGVYRVRVIYDLNGDGKWTTGDFASGRQPEPVSYYPSEIELRVGYEIEQDWDIGIKNFKNPKLVEKKKGK